MDREDIRHAVEERASILEYDAGMSRWLAQETAAKAHGFDSWMDFQTKHPPSSWRSVGEVSRNIVRKVAAK